MSNLERDDIKHSITGFDTLIADNTKNEADIASHYSHSPERHRLYINGSRFFLQYNTTTKFEDAPDSYILKPAAGDVIEYTTAERFRYVVGYEIAVSQAFQVSQSLQTGDKVVVGYGDPDLENDMAAADGWFVEFVPELPDDRAYLTTYRDGTQIDSQLIQNFEKDLTVWKRLEQVFNWYNVGRRELVETFTYRGTQDNPVVQDSSIDNDKGPVTANHRVTFAVKAGTGTDNLELDCGSIAAIIKGNPTPFIRAKSLTQTGSHSGGGQWEAIGALRVDPDRPKVNTQVTATQIMELSENDDAQLMVIAFAPDNTDATNFSSPLEHNEDNSVVEIADDADVTTFVDEQGNSVTATDNPGGYQLSYASRYTSGRGTNQRQSSAERVRKRTIYNGDEALILAKANTAMDITFEVETEQDW